MLQVFYLDVAHAFAIAFQAFSGVFASVSDAYFKYFICLQTCVVNVSSGYFKSRLDIVAGDSPAAAGAGRGK